MKLSEMDAVADAIATAITNATRPLEKRITKLEGLQLKYVGVWKHGAVYAPGQFVTEAGALWHCNYQTTARPGESSSDWTLAVKSGRDK